MLDTEQDNDLVVEPMSLSSSSQPPRPPATSSSSSPPPRSNDQARARSSGEYFIYASFIIFFSKSSQWSHSFVLCCVVCWLLTYVLDFSAGSTNRTSGTSATAAGPNPAPLRWDRQTILFSVNAWVRSFHCLFYKFPHNIFWLRYALFAFWQFWILITLVDWFFLQFSYFYFWSFDIVFIFVF